MALTDDQLRALYEDMESERVERKANEKDRKDIRRAVCAFANDLPGSGSPGVIFVGQDDDGSNVGHPITDELLTRLAQIPAEGKIQPIPSIDVRKLKVSDGEVAAIVVAPAAAPPVRLDGRVFIRRGPTTQQANAEDERRLVERRRASDLPFDVSSIAGASLEDLDLDSFEREYLPQAIAKDVLEENERSREAQLKSLRFLGPEGAPTVLGVLVLGKDPRAWIPGAYVQFVRYEGRDLGSSVRDQKEVDGPMPSCLLRLEDLFGAHNRVRSDLDASAVEEPRPDYPAVAFREITRNAVMHRSYDGSHAPIQVRWFEDRIEVQSPGGPFGMVTPANFGKGVADYRNPHLAAALKDLGFVQKFGSGIPRARAALRENGNPDPGFEVVESWVSVTVWRSK